MDNIDITDTNSGITRSANRPKEYFKCQNLLMPEFDLSYSKGKKALITLNYDQNAAGARSFGIFKKTYPGSSYKYVKFVLNRKRTSTEVDLDVENANKYTYLVRPYIMDQKGKKIYGQGKKKDFNFFYKPSLTASTRTVGQGTVLKWKKQENATGYTIYRWDSEKKAYVRYRTAGANDTYIVDTNTNSGQTYFYRIRAFRQVPDAGTLVSPRSDEASCQAR